MDVEVRHDKENECFVAELDGFEALLDYSIDGNEINFYHTFSPPQLRGKGLAKKIVEYAFNYARENNLKVIPGCSYVQAFVERNDKYGELLA